MFIKTSPFGFKFLNKPILLLSFNNKSTSTVVVENDVYSTLYSMLKSEKDGTSIFCGKFISVIDGKSFTAVKVIKAVAESPVPYLLLLANKTIFLVP